MEKRFNITGCCYPDKHYMVDISEKLIEIKRLVDKGEYFIINKARQYGKTTTLKMLRTYLGSSYVILSLDFQSIGAGDFQDEYRFSKVLAEMLLQTVRFHGKMSGYQMEASALDGLQRISIQENEKVGLRGLLMALNQLCENTPKPVVLMVDEVDSASNNQVFLDFLGILRNAYMNREEVASLQSVILAGVYDIKNLKHRIRSDEQHKYNSPWNIAADFKVDMSFRIQDIRGMLENYKTDKCIEMDVQKCAELIHAYTSGYPYLVSYICKLVDEEQQLTWDKEGILKAVNIVVKGPNTLYDDMIKHVTEYRELYDMLSNILFGGEYYPYQVYDLAVDIGSMFGFIIDRNGEVAIANRIFETQLYNFFLAVERKENNKAGDALPDRNQFIKSGKLDMDMVMQKFFEYYESLSEPEDEAFVEKCGRKLFLLYLRPIINGTGNYYIEDQSRTKYRTDVVVDYKGEQYIIELKIWRGEEYNRRGEEQLFSYLDAYGQKRGYLLSFCFQSNKARGMNEIKCGNKTILEVVV